MGLSQDSTQLNMNYSEKRRPPMENILFPEQKIKPYRQSNSNLESPAELAMRRTKEKLHLLEVTQPHLLLQKIFEPYLLLVKILGCQPLKMENGSLRLVYCSWNVAYCIFIFGMFVCDTIYFFPIMKFMNSEQNNNFLVYLTQILLVLSQIFAAQISYIFMAVRAKQRVRFWNRLQAVLVKLVGRCSHLDLVPSYRNARWKIVVWLLFTVVFGSCHIVSFQDDIRKYLTEQAYHPVYHWFMLFGFGFYSIILSFHILHSTCFTTFICVLCSCFKTLGNVALKQDGEGIVNSSQSPVLFQEVSEMYEELIGLKTLLGDLYGIYIAMEILAMIICTTINFFFMISNPGVSTLFCLNLAIAMPYLIWFHELCLSGGDLFHSMKKCYSNIRKAMRNAAKKVSISEISLLQIDPPDCLTAAGYFLVDVPLFTTVIGTIATYLVVTLQFRTGMNVSQRTNGSHYHGE